MGRSRGGRGVGAGVLVAGVAMGLGCHRREPTAEPEVEPCDSVAGCDEPDLGTTVRQHSEQAGTFVEVSAGCPYAPDDVPPVASLDDRSIPEFDAARDRPSNLLRGEERLQDIDLHAIMMGLQPQLFACVDLAACYEDGAKLSGSGELEFDFELSPDGSVAAISVHPSPGLDHPSVIGCARRTVARHRFPSYDGGQMMVSYRMTIEAVLDP